MCLIIYKEAGAKLPPDEWLKEAFRVNSDGFGLAFPVKNTDEVAITKGAMSEREMMHMIKELRKHASDLKRVRLLMHFRHATEGSVWAGNCHPFPLTTDEDKLQATYIRTKVAIAHNGVILHLDNDELDKREKPADGKQQDVKADESKLGYYHGGVWHPPRLGFPGRYHYDNDDLYGMDGYSGYYAGNVARTNVTYGGLTKRFSDSQVFIRDYLAPLQDVLFTKPLLDLISNYVGSKFVFMSHKDTELLGDFHETDGVYYSNYSYKPTSAARTYTTVATAAKDETKVAASKNTGMYTQCDACKGFYLKSEVLEVDKVMLCKDCAEKVGDAVTTST